MFKSNKDLLRFHSSGPSNLRGIRLYGSQVVLQGQAPVVVEYGLNSGKMSLHQPLPLSCHLLLQRLQHRLEVLVQRR